MPITPEYLPSELHYIIPLAELHGSEARVVGYDPALGRRVFYGERLSAEEIEPLRQLYVDIRDRGHAVLITGWHQAHWSDSPPETSWPVYGLLCLFQQLGERGVEPFDDEAVSPRSGESGTKRLMDPAKLPESLRPFVALYEKWGDVESDTTRYALMDRALADPFEMSELKEWHAKLSKVDPASWEAWVFDAPLSPLDENYERAKVYFTGFLLYGELEIDKR